MRYLSAQNDVSEHDRVVVILVMSRINERDGTLSRERTQSAQQLRILMQLRAITAAKLLPAIRIVPEPFS